MSADQELVPLDRRLLFRLHEAGLDVLQAYLRSERQLRAQADRAQLEPGRRIVRRCGEIIRVT